MISFSKQLDIRFYGEYIGIPLSSGTMIFFCYFIHIVFVFFSSSYHWPAAETDLPESLSRCFSWSILNLLLRLLQVKHI